MRLPRSFILEEGSLFHVTWQCHNKSWLLKHFWVKKLYYSLLLRYKEQYGVTFYSYTMMDNHIHLSGKLTELKSFSAFFRIVNSLFAKILNKEAGRCGQVVRDRFKSIALQSDQDLLQEMIYHDLNEVRAGKALHPKHNELSSYAHYAHGKEDPLLTDPTSYLQLGSSPAERQIAYQAMVQEILSACPRKKDSRSAQKYFLGDPLWVEAQYKRLKELRSLLIHSRKKTKEFSSLSP